MYNGVIRSTSGFADDRVSDVTVASGAWLIECVSSVVLRTESKISDCDIRRDVGTLE